MTQPAENNVISVEQWLSGKPAQPPPPPPPPGVVVQFSGNADPYARKAIDEECAILSTTTEGSRNHQLNVSAFKLASLVDAGRAGRDETINLLQAAARSSGLDESEIMPTINSAFRGSAAKVGARVVPELEPIAPAYVLDPEDVQPPAAPCSASDNDRTPNTPPASTVDILALERDFWDRPSLKHIRDAALNRMCAPWAVLAHCVARALAFVPTTAVLPPLIGGDRGGSLNWYAVAVDRSGGGKSAAAQVAKSLIPHSADTRHLGSGEGLVECYWPAFEPPKSGDEEFANTHPRAFIFQADEIDTIGALGARTGSTLMPHLRTAFTGGSLGGGYRGRTKQIIPEQEYRLTLVVSAQPRRCASILADADGGTPQRFMWFPANDPRISAAKARPFDPITPLEIATDYLIGKYIPIPASAQKLILEQCELRGKGAGEALDGHAVFCREKFAYALAVLDGRNQMSEDDWELSGIAADVSNAIRDWAAACVADSATEDAEDRGRLAGVSASAADEEKTRRASERMRAVGRLVMERLASGPMTQGALNKSLNRDARPYLVAALQALQVAEMVTLDEQRRWVKR